jgi:threonine dehydrogenase-like Zn-dependent dehydrogenase
MAAAVLAGPGSLTLEQRPVPEVEAPDDVIVEIAACGVCGSDLQMLAVPPAHPARVGVILGHEISGRVVDQGPDVDPPAGLVVVDPDVKCGVCSACRQGHPSSCRRMIAMGVDADGGFAAYCRVPARNVYQISETVSPVAASFAEPLAAVLNGVGRVRPRIGESAVVIGAGPVGYMFLASMRQSGVAPIWLIDPAEARRAKALRLGATGAVGEADAYRDAVRAGTAPPPDIVVDAVGKCLSDALELVATGGRVLLFGIDDRPLANVRQFDITSREVSILGALTSRFTFPAAIRAIESKTIDPEDLDPYEVGLTDLPEALDLLRRREVLKAVVRPGT